jgi:hypothetical protein
MLPSKFKEGNPHYLYIMFFNMSIPTSIYFFIIRALNNRNNPGNVKILLTSPPDFSS